MRRATEDLGGAARHKYRGRDRGEQIKRIGRAREAGNRKETGRVESAARTFTRSMYKQHAKTSTVHTLATHRAKVTPNKFSSKNSATVNKGRIIKNKKKRTQPLEFPIVELDARRVQVTTRKFQVSRIDKLDAILNR